MNNFVTTKDLVLMESLISDGVEIPKKYQEMVWWKVNHPDLKLKIQKLQQKLDEDESKRSKSTDRSSE